jgi:hypothetical protein
VASLAVGYSRRCGGGWSTGPAAPPWASARPKKPGPRIIAARAGKSFVHPPKSWSGASRLQRRVSSGCRVKTLLPAASGERWSRDVRQCFLIAARPPSAPRARGGEHRKGVAPPNPPRGAQVPMTWARHFRGDGVTPRASATRVRAPGVVSTPLSSGARSPPFAESVDAEKISALRLQDSRNVAL